MYEFINGCLFTSDFFLFYTYALVNNPQKGVSNNNYPSIAYVNPLLQFAWVFSPLYKYFHHHYQPHLCLWPIRFENSNALPNTGGGIQRHINKMVSSCNVLIERHAVVSINHVNYCTIIRNTFGWHPPPPPEFETGRYMMIVLETEPAYKQTAHCYT